MTTLIEQRCQIHAGRDAAVRCPNCRRFFCRECVTEHAGRMMCAACVAQMQLDASGRRSRSVLWGMAFLAGLLLAWATFYYLGWGLTRIPDVFHGEAS